MALNNPYALSFDGTDDYIGPISLPAAPRCIEFWFYTPTKVTPSSTKALLGTGFRAVLLGRSTVGTPDATFTVEVGESGRPVATYITDEISAGLHHIAISWSGTTYDIYLDGTKRQRYTYNTGPGFRLLPASPYKIGCRNWEVGELYYKGSIDEIRFWSVSRSDAEIIDNMNKKLTGNEPGLMLYYRFDEGAGNTATDSSPSGKHGTINGATWVPGLVDLEGLAPPGRVDISATLRGTSSATAKADRVRVLSAHLTGAATSTGGTPIRIRGLSANLQGAGTTNVRMNLIAALKAHLQGQATLKSNILVLFVPEGVYVIDADEIFAKNQPSRGQVVANYIEVWINPLKPMDEPEEVYRSKDPITIPAGETKTITIHFDDEPVTEPVATLEEAGAGLSIVDTKYYAWGADVMIQNTGVAEQTCIIVATGKPLKVQGREKIVKEDPVSIQENGLKKYTFDNPFVQDRATAELIGNRLLSYANAKRDIEIDWRGDPALELADVTMIPEYQRRGLDQRGIFYITKQELEFDGGLQAKLEGRKM